MSNNISTQLEAIISFLLAYIRAHVKLGDAYVSLEWVNLWSQVNEILSNDWEKVILVWIYTLEGQCNSQSGE